MVKGSNRKRAPKTARKLKNTNRIVRVHNNKANAILQHVSDDLGCPYQLAFDEFLEYAFDEMQFSNGHFQTVIKARLLEKYTE